VVVNIPVLVLKKKLLFAVLPQILRLYPRGRVDSRFRSVLLAARSKGSKRETKAGVPAYFLSHGRFVTKNGKKPPLPAV
jgi:hypothetical protein